MTFIFSHAKPADPSAAPPAPPLKLPVWTDDWHHLRCAWPRLSKAARKQIMQIVKTGGRPRRKAKARKRAPTVQPRVSPPPQNEPGAAAGTAAPGREV